MNEGLSVSDKIKLYKLPIILFTCKPLMPKNSLIRMRVVFQYLLMFLKRKSHSPTLPIEGDIVIETNQKYKIICMREKVIYTFSDNLNEELCTALTFNSTSLMYEKILGIDNTKNTIKGFFYNGYHPSLLKKNKKLNYKIESLFIDLIKQSTYRYKKAEDYADELKSTILLDLERNSNLITTQQLDITKRFILNSYESFINSYPKEYIMLIISHGDIKQDNIIEYKNNLTLIDWEFCNYRSLLFDLYKFRSRFENFDSKFYENLIKRLMNEKSRGNNLSDYFNNYLNSSEDLFYLEDIKLRLFQFENRNFSNDFNKIIKFIGKTNKIGRIKIQ